MTGSLNHRRIPPRKVRGFKRLTLWIPVAFLKLLRDALGDNGRRFMIPPHTEFNYYVIRGQGILAQYLNRYCDTYGVSGPNYNKQPNSAHCQMPGFNRVER